MRSDETANLWRISVVFENRSDGGLRVYSDDVPGFVLSHPNRELVLADVMPALETIIGEMMGARVLIKPLDIERSLPWLPANTRQKKFYEARRAA
ncbi:hypothetical protein ACMDCR_22440 [Labrys okinawensis]|uniref:hypothetical protein n=1 Tax=Labrys okinawensis TaxID=346911 RepID=UPI0039BD08CE